MPAAKRNRRVSITLPAALVQDARETAGKRGDVLSDFVRGAIITATRAAETGDKHLPPAVPAEPRPRLPRHAGGGVVSFRYLAPEAEEARCVAALTAAGSSLAAVAEEALRSYLKYEGSRLDVVVPGDPWRRWRSVGAA